MVKIFGIRNKVSNEFLIFNSKCAWSKAGNAKNAWANATKRYGVKFVPFDEQNEHEIVELTDYFYRYEDLCK